MFHFSDEWRFEARVDAVWPRLSDVEAWPTWWPDYRKAMVRITGPVYDPAFKIDCEVRGPLPLTSRFTLTVVSYHAPQLIEFKSSGDLVGAGRLELAPSDGGSAVSIRWNVSPTAGVMRILSDIPIIRRILEKNHEMVMRSGYEALKRSVEAPS